MRILFVAFLLISCFSADAQSFVRPAITGYNPMGIGGIRNFPMNNRADKPWFLSSYTGISTGIGFYNGVRTGFVSVPFTLQLNRQINKNLYAFGALTAAPVYTNFHTTFLSTDPKFFTPYNNSFRSFQPGLYSRAEMGLYYINDNKTFSVSGSIGIERSSYPMLPFYHPNANKQNPVYIPQR